MSDPEAADRLARALEDAGLIREPAAESWTTVVAPPWWAGVEPPEPRCPWCQRRSESDLVCDRCAAAAQADPDAPPLIAHWARLPAEARRLHLAARYGTDPWSGRPVRIEIEWTDVDHSGAIGTARHRLIAPVPHTSWDAPEA